MGAWYTIGASLGVGLGSGVLLGGMLGWSRIGAGVAAIAAAAIGVAFTFGFGPAEPIAAGVGGLIGALSVAVVVRGALLRGGTRIGMAAFMGAIALLIWALGAIPIVGYIEAFAIPFLATRVRGRQAERFAGLRTLAK